MAMFARRRFSIGGAKIWPSPDNPLHSIASGQSIFSKGILGLLSGIRYAGVTPWILPQRTGP